MVEGQVDPITAIILFNYNNTIPITIILITMIIPIIMIKIIIMTMMIKIIIAVIAFCV